MHVLAFIKQSHSYYSYYRRKKFQCILYLKLVHTLGDTFFHNPYEMFIMRISRRNFESNILLHISNQQFKITTLLFMCLFQFLMPTVYDSKALSAKILYKSLKLKVVWALIYSILCYFLISSNFKTLQILIDEFLVSYATTQVLFNTLSPKIV